jgi:F-type H+-transporting ATPase subunit delta
MASVPGTYARAFADVILDKHLDAGKVLQELHTLVQLLMTNEELREVWEAPSIRADQKRGLLDAIAGRESVSRPVRNFIAVLIDHKRIPFLQPIVRQLERELNRRLGFAEAEIVSARELRDSERQELESQVGKLTGKKVRAHYSKDGSLLGGAVIKVGSTIYDGSVKGQLERIREQVAST